MAPLDQRGQRSSGPDSDSEELVPVETDSEADAAQEGRRCPAPASDSDELVPAAPCRREEARHDADNDFFSSEPSRPSRSNLSRLRPWTQHTDLSKALTRVLRHRSSLHLDYGRAGSPNHKAPQAHDGLDNVHNPGQRQAEIRP